MKQNSYFIMAKKEKRVKKIGEEKEQEERKRRRTVRVEGRSVKLENRSGEGVENEARRGEWKGRHRRRCKDRK